MLGSGRLKKVAVVIAVVVAVYGAACAAFYWVMRQPPSEFGRIMAKVPMPLMMVLPFETMWNIARGGELKLGDTAPDFSLPARGKGESVRLSAFRGSKPVVLVFGSYT